MARLELRLLAIPEVYLDGLPLHFTRRRSLALLSYLAVTRRSYPRDSLATFLSGDCSDGQAAKQLSNALAELKRLLGGYILATRQTVAFNSRLSYDLDVESFHAAAQQGIQHSDPLLIARAAGLYGADFLDGFALPDAPDFEAWLRSQRDTLNVDAVAVLKATADQALRQRNYIEGLITARRLLALEPWSQEAHYLLILCLARSGQREAALIQYEASVKTLREEADEAPSPELEELHQRLRAAAAPPRHNVPLSSQPLNGRADELAHTIDLLSDPSYRIVSITGLGGSGKTRLAIAVASAFTRPAATRSEQPFPDGIFFIRLARLRPAAGKPPAELALRFFSLVGAEIGIDLDYTKELPSQLQAALANKGMLLVLDGADGLAPAIELFASLIAAASRVKLMITTRRNLHLPAEWTIELSGLSLPDGDGIESSGAGQLFLETASRVAGPLRLDAAERRSIAEVCRLVGGLPLALKLAAGWMRALSPHEIAAELRRGPDLLASSLEAGNERQPVLRHVLEETWDMLGGEEQAVLRKLSVIEDSFDRDTARVIGEASLTQLLTLRDSSALEVAEQGRFRLPPLLRGYAAEQLHGEPEEAELAQARHSAYYSDLLQRRVAALLEPEGNAPSLDEGEIENVRAAWAWAVRRVQFSHIVDMRGALALWYELTERFEEGAKAFDWAADVLRTAIAHSPRPDPLLRIALQTTLVEQVRFLVRQGQLSKARPLLEESGDGQDALSLHLDAYLESSRAQSLWSDGDLTDALDRYRNALALARAAGAHTLEAMIAVRVSMIQASVALEAA
jgi:predicted ATPase/DNA-binding SARP family transcriptional activator